MQTIKGQPFADKILISLKKQIKKEALTSKLGLAIILVGNNLASQIYVKKKLALAKELGIKGELFPFEQTTNTTSLIKKIKELNRNSSFNGIIIQLPLPNKINTAKVLSTIKPQKDVDGLHPLNIGKITLGDKTGIAGATPQGIMFLLEENKLSLLGKKVVLVGYGNTVGKLLTPLLINAGATVTICTEFTKDLQKHTQRADIIISAVGQKNIISQQIIKKESIILNIGCCRFNNKLYGDIDPQNIEQKASFFVPAVGGVGPLTTAFLFKNLVEKCK